MAKINVQADVKDLVSRERGCCKIYVPWFIDPPALPDQARLRWYLQQAVILYHTREDSVKGSVQNRNIVSNPKTALRPLNQKHTITPSDLQAYGCVAVYFHKKWFGRLAFEVKIQV